MIEIRKAKEEDLKAIVEIYNEAVVNTTATFDTEDKTIGDATLWLTNRDENFPVIVAVRSNEIVGYAALNKWSDRKAYDITAEISLYVKANHRRQGMGKTLIDVIVKAAGETNLHSIIARITEGNEQSVYLHKANGFKTIGVMQQVGRKFGQLLNVTLMQKMLK